MPPENERSHRRIVPGAWVRGRKGMNVHMYDTPGLGTDCHEPDRERPFHDGLVIARVLRPHHPNVARDDEALFVLDTLTCRTGWCYISAVVTSLAT